MTAKTEADVERAAEVDVLLQDGTIARVRDAVPEDRGQLVDLHVHLSDLGRYRRFFHVGHFDSPHFVDQPGSLSASSRWGRRTSQTLT